MAVIHEFTLARSLEAAGLPNSGFERSKEDYQEALKQPNLLGNQILEMDEEGEVYEFIFVHESQHVYSKINLCPDGTVIIIYSAHRPLKGTTL